MRYICYGNNSNNNFINVLVYSAVGEPLIIEGTYPVTFPLCIQLRQFVTIPANLNGIEFLI